MLYKIHLLNAFHVRDDIVDLMFELEDQKKYQLQAPNGRGKSSLIRFLKQNQHFFFPGKSCLFVDQMSFDFLDNFRVKEILSLHIQVIGHDTFNPSLSPFETVIQSLDDHYFFDLSGGQKQLLKIHLSLSQHFDLLFLDEPFQFLDEKYCHTLKSYLIHLEKTCLLVDHQNMMNEFNLIHFVDLKDQKRLEVKNV